MEIPYFDEKNSKFIPEKNKIIEPNKTPIIIIGGYFIFRNKKIIGKLNLKIYKEDEVEIIKSPFK